MLRGFFVVLSDVLDGFLHILDGLNIRMEYLIGIFGVPEVEVISAGDALGLLKSEIDMKMRIAILVFLFRNNSLVDCVL